MAPRAAKNSGESIKDYKKRVDTALHNTFLRQAMDKFAVAYRGSRKNAFSGMDEKALIRAVADIKADACQKNEALLAAFTKKAESHGIHVHLAKTAEDANRIIAEIAEKTGSKNIIKSKSMTAEEIHLNKFLEARGCRVVETDLGEWIVQLRKEGPSHMVMPAIHLSRFQVADLFTDVTGTTQDSQIEKLVKVARKELREKFVNADLGITGANFVLADTGTIGIATNEGNARLVSTLPRVHVVLAGFDKLLPGIKEALAVTKVLPRNATGQAITSYVTWITGPSQCTTCTDGKREMHVVLLDNGRSAIAKDPVFAQALQCVRCGACANVCPVYRMVGGHQLGHVYIGAIGLITTYFFHGRQHARHLVKNCTNCGACKEVCAAGIDLPNLIKDVHARIQDEEGHPLQSIMLGKVLKNRKLFHTLLRTAQKAQGPMTRKEKGAVYLRHLPMIFSDQNFRRLPAIAKVPFRDRFEKLEQTTALQTRPKFKVALFSGCVQDFVYPEQLEAAMKGFQEAGAKVCFPMNQTCCGLPAVSMGEKAAARDVALQNIEAFENENVDYIVTLCASCASHLKHGVPRLIREYAPDKSAAFSDKVMTFSQFMAHVTGVTSRPGSAKKTAFHSPCHLCRGLGETTAPRTLIVASGNIYTPTAEEETCCGFGGSFSASYPEVSKEIVTRKLDDVEKSGADLLVTECPGCVLQLRGGALEQGRSIEVLHLAEMLYPL